MSRLDEIEKALWEIDAQKAALRDKARDLIAERDALFSEHRAAALVASLSPAERDAVVRVASLSVSGTTNDAEV